MQCVKDKYVDTPDYVAVYRSLLSAACRRKFVFAHDVADIMGLPPHSPISHAEVNQMLAEISQNEHLQGRPLISALVIDSRNVPGKAFFALARALGRLTEDTPQAEELFWESEREAVYGQWVNCKAIAPGIVGRIDGL